MLNRYIEIKDFDEKYSLSFASLNRQWLLKYFFVDEYHEEILSNPRKHIISKGGHIYFAICQDEVVGTTALIKRSEGEFQLCEMAVSEEFQGRGVGKLLMDKVISVAKKEKINRLFIESNTKLTKAMGLYLSYGFSEVPSELSSPYEMFNIRMELKL